MICIYDTRQITRFELDAKIEKDERVAEREGWADKTTHWNGEILTVEWLTQKQPTRQQMGKLQEVAARIAATQKKLNDEADKLALELDGLDKKAPEAFDRGHRIVAQHNADIDAMKTELAQLSNLPIAD